MHYKAGRHAHIGWVTKRTGGHKSEQKLPGGSRGGRKWEGAQGEGRQQLLAGGGDRVSPPFAPYPVTELVSMTLSGLPCRNPSGTGSRDLPGSPLDTEQMEF